MKHRFPIISAVTTAFAILLLVWQAVSAVPTLQTNNSLNINKGDQNAVIDASLLEANDPDNPGAPAGSFVFVVESTPANGTLQLDGATLVVSNQFTQNDINIGLLNYDHNNSLTGSDSFTFSIVGGPQMQTFTINVNLPPVTAPDTIHVSEGGTTSDLLDGNANLAANDSDPDGDDANLVISTTAIIEPNFDTFFDLGSDGSFDYTHDGSENLSDSFVYEICDPGGLCTQETVTINITGVVDIAPVFNPAGPFTISEGSSNGPTSDTLTAADEEVTVGGYDTLTYTITDGDPDIAFGIDDSSGVTGAFLVSNRNKLDFETTDTYILTIEVMDESGATDSGQVTINITDANDAPVITPGQSFNVPENSNNGTNVGNVAAADADAADAGNLTFAITNGNTNSAFDIDNNGKLTVNNSGALNFENKSSFTLEITVTDSGWDGQGAKQDVENVTVNISDVNEAPVITPSQSFNLPENSSVSTVVGTVATTDVDAADSGNLMFAITDGNTNNTFTISNSGGLTVNNNSLLNFEGSPNSFTLEITVTDSGWDGQGAKQDVENVTVNLTDVNEAPVITPSQSFNLPENSSVSTVVGTVAATDVDADDIGALAFAITGGNTGNSFTINSSNGQLTVNNNSLLDFEGSPNSFTLEITVTDSGWDGQGTKQDIENVTIDLTNVNESPSILGGQTFSVPSKSVNGTVVGTVSATDPDANTILTYQIVGGNTGSAFAINNSTGVITVNDGSQLQDDVKPSYSLSIRVTDNGTPTNLFVNGTVEITITPAIIYKVMLPLVLNNYPTDEPNNSCADAFSISRNNLYSFEPNDAEDWYKFTLPSSRPVTVILSNYLPSVGQIIAYSGSCGSLNFLKNNGDFTTTKILNLGTLSAGTYYIRIVTDPPFVTTKYNLQINTP